MKKRISTAFLAVFLALTMLLATPLAIAAAELQNGAEESEEPAIDYTPFLIESVDGYAVYNKQTADLSYEFYMQARNYIDGKAKTFTKITYNGIDYPVDSVLYMPSGSYPTCDMLTCIVNFTLNDVNKHIILIAFRGTEFSDWQEVKTDLACESGKDGYHEGFEEAAQKHYEYLVNYSVEYNLGKERITFSDYLKKMQTDDNCDILVVGHSLGAAVAGVFTSKYLDRYENGAISSNVVSYTFASPLTCTPEKAAKEVTTVRNVFNFINKDDFITIVGADIFDGDRTGFDLKYRLDKYTKLTKEKVQTVITAGAALGIVGVVVAAIVADWDGYMDNHHMGTAYKPTKNYINDNIYKQYDRFVLYNHFDTATGAYQRIIYDNGALTVSGSGKLLGDWRENTLLPFTKVAERCNYLEFADTCTITEIGDKAFMGMETLTGTLTLPDSLTQIGNYAFAYCAFNCTLKISSNIRIGSRAFSNCTNLSVIWETTELLWGHAAFENCAFFNAPNINFSEKESEIFGFYYAEDAHGIFQVSPLNAANNPILRGDKIYMGRFSDHVIDEDPSVDYFYFLISNEIDALNLPDYILEDIQKNQDNYTSLADDAIIIDKKSGQVEISTDCPIGTAFTVIVLNNYGNVPVIGHEDERNYTSFVVTENNFAGGTGTEDRPYLISNADQLFEMAKVEGGLSAHYRLIADIDCTNSKAWSTLGSISAPFTGTIDGNGYTINAISGGALVAYNHGTIKNLTITNASLSEVVVYSETGSGNVGAFAAWNRGTIQNCHLQNSKIDVTRKYNSAACHLSVGGIVGLNLGDQLTLGTLENCSVTNTKLTGDSRGGDGHYNAYLNIGGLAARNSDHALIKNCASYENTIKGHIYHNGTAGDKSYAYFRLGGVVGYAEDSSQIENVYYDNPKPTYDRDFYDHELVVDKNYALLEEALTAYGVAKADSTATLTNVAKNTERPSVKTAVISGIQVTEAIHKSHYYVGDEFNPYGLVIANADDTAKLIYGYKISDFHSESSGELTLTVTYETGDGIYSIPVSTEPAEGEAVVTVTVEEIVPETIVLTSKETGYLLANKDSFTLDDFKATVYYSNGTVESVEDVNELVAKHISFLPINVGELGVGIHILTMTYSYQPTTATAPIFNNITVRVELLCEHPTSSISGASAATISTYGYSGDSICDTCHTIVEDGVLLAKLPCTDHIYKTFDKHDQTQHIGICDCGESAYFAHKWDSGIVTNPATHTAVGEKLLTCTDCGETKTAEIPALTEHQYGEWQPHNAEQHKHTCVLDGCTHTEYADHSWDNFEVTTPATHFANGVRTYTCDCGETKTEDIPMFTAHEYGAWQKHNATQHKRVCEIDGCTDTEYETHHFDNGEITTPATHLEKGIMTYTCTDCGEFYTEPIEKTALHAYGAWQKHNETQHKRECACTDVEYADHSWNSGEVTTPATHTTLGVKTYTCTDCGETKTEDIAKLSAHEYGAWHKHNEAQHKRACACGEAEYGNHNWDNGIVTTEASHLAEGVKTYTCADCGEVKTEAILKTATHTYGEWTTVKEATTEAPGLREKSCACGEKISEEIPQLTTGKDMNTDQSGDQSNTEDKGISTGAIIGIAGGSTAVVGGGGFALWWFLIRRKRRML